MTVVGSATLELLGDSAQFRAEMDKASGHFKKIGGQLTGIGKSLSMKVTAPLLGVAGAALKVGTDFNKGMANVNALMPGATERVRELGDEVQDMAVRVGKSTGDLTDGLYQVVSAFGDTADTAEILEINARSAAAGMAETTDAINLTSAVTKAYGDTSAGAVQQASDLAQLTVRLGQTTFPELAASIGRVTPLTAELGIAQEELFGTLATFTGVTGGAAEVSTQLRGVLQSLMAPTADMSALFDDLGVESGKALIGQRGLQGAMEAIVGAAEASGTPLQKFMTSIEGQALALSASGAQADTFTAKLAEMQGAAGATDEAFAAQTEGVNAAGFAWQQAKANIETALISIGDILAPVFMEVSQHLSTAVSWFRELDTGVQKNAVIVGALVAAIGPLLIALGTMVTGAGAVVAAVGAVGAPVAAAIAAVAGLTAGLGVAYAKSETFRKVVGTAVSAASEIVQSALGKAREALSFLAGHAGEIAAEFSATFAMMSQQVRAIWAEWGDEITVHATAVWDSVKAVTSSAFGVLKAIIGGAITVLAETVKLGLNLMQGDWEGVWGNLSAIVGAVKDTIVGIVTSMWDGVRGVFTAGVEAITSVLEGGAGRVIDVFAKMKSVIVGSSIVPDMVDAIGGEFVRMAGDMEGTAAGAADATEAAFQGLRASLDDVAKEAQDAGKKSKKFGKDMDDVTKAVVALAKEQAHIPQLSEAIGESFDETGATTASLRAAVEALTEAGLDLEDEIPGLGMTLGDLSGIMRGVETQTRATTEAQRAFESQVSSAMSVVRASVPEHEALRSKLDDLKVAYDAGRISQEEFEQATAHVQDQLHGTSEAMAVFRNLIDKTKTSEDKLAETQAQLTKLLKAGKISQDDYTQAMQQAEDQILGTESATDKLGKTFGDLKSAIEEHLGPLPGFVDSVFSDVRGFMNLAEGAGSIFEVIQNWKDFAVEFVDVLLDLWDEIGGIVSKFAKAASFFGGGGFGGGGFGGNPGLPVGAQPPGITVNPYGTGDGGWAGMGVGPLVPIAESQLLVSRETRTLVRQLTTLTQDRIHVQLTAILHHVRRGADHLQAMAGQAGSMAVGSSASLTPALAGSAAGGGGGSHFEVHFHGDVHGIDEDDLARRLSAAILPEVDEGLGSMRKTDKTARGAAPSLPGRRT